MEVQATTAGEVGGDAAGGSLLEDVNMHGRGDGCATTVDLLGLPGVLNLDPCGEHWVKGAILNRDDDLAAPEKKNNDDPLLWPHSTVEIVV